MSEPLTATEHLSHHAACEIISGMSALHMNPDPIPTEKQTPENNGYLTDVDGWAKHSIEHFRAAIDSINQLNHQKESLRTELYKFWGNLCKDTLTEEEHDKFFPQFEELLDKIERIWGWG